MNNKAEKIITKILLFGLIILLFILIFFDCKKDPSRNFLDNEAEINMQQIAEVIQRLKLENSALYQSLREQENEIIELESRLSSIRERRSNVSNEITNYNLIDLDVFFTNRGY